MKLRNPIITDAGIVIDPDDDADIIQHQENIILYEFVYDKHTLNCTRIYPYNYD